MGKHGCALSIVTHFMNSSSQLMKKLQRKLPLIIYKNSRQIHQNYYQNTPEYKIQNSPKVNSEVNMTDLEMFKTTLKTTTTMKNISRTKTTKTADVLMIYQKKMMTTSSKIHMPDDIQRCILDANKSLFSVF